MDRREMIRRIALGGTTIMVMPGILTSCQKDDPNPGPDSGNPLLIDLTLAENSALLNTNGFKIISGVMVVNTGSGNYVAVSATCTHQGCTISYSAGSNVFPCPCHGSVYALTGSVINGPATQALEAYTVTRTGDILKIE